MIKTLIFLVLLTIFQIHFVNSGKSEIRLKPADNGFILRSCQASVQLHRKYRTNTDTKVIKSSGSQNVDYPKSVSLQDNVARRLKFGDRTLAYIGWNGRSNVKTRETRDEKVIVKDTPIMTIDVKTVIKDKPQIFKKKDSLPQLSRSASAKKLDSEASIIIVEKVH